MALRILLVEDYPDCATTTALALRVWGYAVQVARNGIEAVAACRRETPDVVLLDIGLPGMSGYDVAKQLRNEFGEATPRLIAVTGYGRREDRQRSAEAGIELHLVKPVDLIELDSILCACK